MKNQTPVVAVLLCVASLFLTTNVAHAAEYDYTAPEPGTYTLPIIKVAGDGDVLDSTGKSMRLRELTKGRVTVMSFIYTRCASSTACPYATGVLRQLHAASAEGSALAKGLRLVSMSFDSSTDTPRRMAEYAALAGGQSSAAPWKFITTRSQAELQPILDAYGQTVDKRKDPNHPLGPLNHILRVYLIDRDSNIRNIYSSGTLDSRLVLADIKTLLLEANASNLTSK
jgi:cytochrome oxidase Cu insertion factor (SCO1/SenC/PrrC family)